MTSYTDPVVTDRQTNKQLMDYDSQVILREVELS